MPAAPGSAHASDVDAVALARTVSRLLRDARTPWLHEEAARRMAERLPLVKLQPARVLDWSGPLGGSTALLRAAYPQARLLALALDGAAAAPPPPRERWWTFGRGTRGVYDWRRADELQPGEAELLWSNMALQGHADVQALFAQWHRALAVGGFLMFSTLGPGTLAELREVYRRHGWGEPMAPLIDMHDLGDGLVQAGFADPVMDQETLTLTWTNGDAMLAELRGLGANLSPRRHAGCRTPRWREQLVSALVQEAGDARPRCSFEIVYGHAFRAAPRVRVQPETTVSLDAMRAQIRRSGGGTA